MPDERAAPVPVPSRVFITGGTGFLGRHLLPGLQALLPSATVFSVLSRSPPRASADGVRYIQGDLAHPAAWLEELRHHDLVIWLGADRNHHQTLSQLKAVNVDAVEAAVTAAEASPRVQHFVYVSSVSAVDQASAHFAPTHELSAPAPRTDYGRTKLLAEQRVLRSRLSATVLRLPFVYGPGFAPTSFLAWCRRAARGRVLRCVQLPGSLSLLYAPDLAPLLATLLLTRAGHASREVFCVSDGVVHDMERVVQTVAQLHGFPSPARRLHVPDWLRRLLAWTPYHYWQHAALSPHFFALDSQRLRTHVPGLQFTPLHEGLQASYRC